MANKRNWFFDVSASASYDRFRKNNKPTEATYRRLLDSVPFFLETGDTASESQQGLAKLATDANVKLRTSAGASEVQTLVRPHQLPLMQGSGGTEANTIDTPVAEGGVKLTPKADLTTTRMNFLIELDANNLSVVTFDKDADYVVIEDATDNTTKKALLSTVLAGTNLWKRTGTTLSATTDGDDVDLGSGGTLQCAGLYLENSSDRTIEIPSNTGAGKKLTLKGQTSDDNTGGTLVVKGGDSDAAAVAGSLYLYGGNSSLTDGDVILGYTEAGAEQGKIAIGGVVDATFKFKVHHDTFIDGDLRLTVSNTSAPTTFLGLDGSNDIQKRTSAEVLVDLLGTPTKGDILYYNTSWQRLADPGADSHLKFNNTSHLPEWDTTVLNLDVKVSIDDAATAGYIGAAYNDGVLRIAANGGIAYTDGGDYVSLGLDIYDLPTTLRPPKLAYVAITDGSNVTEKVLYTLLQGGAYGSWTDLEIGVDFTATPTSTSRIATADLTGYYAKGMAVMFKLDSDASYRYAVINDITATYIDIIGDPLIVAADEIEELYIGGYGQVVTESILFGPIANYNANTITTVLNTFSIRTGGFQWLKPEAKLVAFSVIHKTGDSTVDPFVNLRIGGTVTDYVSTSNTNAGLAVGTSKNTTLVDIETTKNLVEYGDTIEVKVDKNGGTGDADDLQIMAIFVYTSFNPTPAP